MVLLRTPLRIRSGSSHNTASAAAGNAMHCSTMREMLINRAPLDHTTIHTAAISAIVVVGENIFRKALPSCMG